MHFWGLLWLSLGVGSLGVIAIFLVAMWRWMRAHEKVAQNLEDLVDVFQKNNNEN